MPAIVEQFSSNDPLVKEAEKRLKRAHADKDLHKGRLDDYYRLVMPWRHQQNNGWTDKYVDEIFDNTAPDSVADFSSDMLATFTPPHINWVSPVPSRQLNRADRESIKNQIIEYNETVFAEIRRSNFAAEAIECYNDLTHGTMAMVIQDVGASEPIHCESVPVTDLLIARGPRKTLGVKAYDMKCYNDSIPELFPDAENEPELMREIQQDGGGERTVRQTIWRDYSEKGDEVYRYVAYTGKYKIGEGKYTGKGAEPLIVARWNTDNATAWGIGPGYLQLPNIKTANLLKELILKGLDYAVDPATTYDDDGVINMEQGIRAGTHIPKAPGSEIQILESAARFDAGYFEKQELNRQIKRGFFQDKPEQLGKTPPTATQWLQEASEAARRMGAPAGRLVVEWLYPVYSRFAYILAERGVLPEVKLNGQIIHLNPMSPLVEAMHQEQALQMQRFIMMMREAFPELYSMIIDNVEAAYYIADKMGIDPSIMPSNKAAIKEQIKAVQAMQMMPQGAENVVE